MSTEESLATDWEGFAEEIARSRDGSTVLFRVSNVLAEEVERADWSEPVKFKFSRNPDGTFEMQLMTVAI